MGYPLLVTTCAGIELLGALVSPTKFIRKNGQAHFIRFWKKYLYPEKPRVSVGNAVYQLARHGLARVFVVKGNLVVVKDEPREHLVYSKTGGLRINAGQLADDLIDAYFSKVKPLLDDDEGEINRETMSKRLIDMKDLYEKDAAVFLSVLETLPRPKTPHPGDGASGASSPVYTNTAGSLSNPPFPPTPEKGTISLFHQPEDRF